MKIILSIFLFIVIHNIVVAQSFVRVDTVPVIDDVLPLRNAWAGGFNYPMFWPIDLNGDNIMDLVTYEPAFAPGHFKLSTFVNHGDSGKVDYVFAPEYISRFPDLESWLVVYDYNCDGKNDLFCLSKNCSCGIMVYRNDYTNSGGLAFTLVADPLLAKFNSMTLNIPANSVSAPAILDVDEDGDMDIIGWPVWPGGLAHYKGLAIDSGWSCDSLRLKWTTDCWGGIAFAANVNCPNLGTFCKESDPDSLHWDTGIAHADDTISCICIYDQDGDTVKDVITGGNGDINLAYLHNGGTTTAANMDYRECNFPSYGPASLSTFPCPYNLDVDNNGKKDLIISPHSVNDFRGIQFYKNTNSVNDTGIFIKQPKTFLQDEMIEVGTIAAPQIFDYDCDGMPDLLIGNAGAHDTTGTDTKGITLYKNTGSASAPVFKLITRDFAGINALNGLAGPFTSTFGDIDGDGDADMITGSGDGKLFLYKNTANGCNPANFQPPSGNYMGIDAGNISVPQLYDLNRDGLLDLVVGCSAGVIRYYQNTGSASAAAFSSTPTNDTLGGIVVRDLNYTTGNAAPVLYSDTGEVRMMVGTYGGKLYIYDNIAGNEMGNYRLADSLINGEDGQNLIPAIGDLNNDNRPDAVVGNTAGGLSLFMNGFMIGVNEAQKTVLPAFFAYPNPVADELHLSFYHWQNKAANVEIVNSIGQVVYSTSINSSQLTISVKNLPNGIYLARFINTENVQSQKLVVKH